MVQRKGSKQRVQRSAARCSCVWLVCSKLSFVSLVFAGFSVSAQMSGPVWGCRWGWGEGSEDSAPWSAGGMSGGTEQADILSVLSLVKERWKVVSVVSPGDGTRRVCVTDIQRQQQTFVHPTALLSLSPWHSERPVARAVQGHVSVRVVLPLLLQYGRSKNSSCIYLCQGAALWRNLPRTAAPSRAPCGALVPDWHRFLPFKSRVT